ncbi:hypothetical protein DITRI_Ditri06bG0044900 [Diplodiscus trichospermus]
MADMESCICLLTFLITKEMFDFYEMIAPSLEKIKMKWPPRSDLKNIKESLKKIENKYADAGIAIDDNTKRRLEEIGDKITRLDEQRREDSIKAKNLAEIFISEGVSVDTLREKLSPAFPWLFLEEIATDEPATGQDQESLQAHGQLQHTVKQLKDLEK